MKRMIVYLKEAGKEERIPPFKKGATNMVKYILDHFDEVEMFCGESFDSEAGMAFSFMREGKDDGPVIWYFLDGMKDEKF
jgi:hypothetical protein